MSATRRAGNAPTGRRASGSRLSFSQRQRARRWPALAALAVVVVVIVVVASSGGSSPGQALSQRFVAAWARSDYAAMYGMIDSATQSAMAPSQFAAAYASADETATALSRRVGHARPAGAMYEVPVTLRTRIFGVIRSSFRLPVISTPKGDRVQWSAQLAFPGLATGERLSRTTRLGARGSILARNGIALAHGPAGAGGQRPSSLGAAAAAITGVLGAIPPEQAAQLRRAGYPPNAQVGLDGLERAFEPELAGTPGGDLLAGGRLLASSPPQPGRSVTTTISPRLQNEALAALGGQEGGIVAMRPDGELLALAGIPLSGLQPPGSTFKMVTVTGVLENHLATAGTSFPVQTQTTLSGVTLQNANGESCGGTLANAFAVSCNSVFAPLGAKLGGVRLVSVARSFGFNQPTGIPGAAESTIPAASITDDLSAGSSAIGQGQVQATALQMATVAATIANRGLRPHPTLELGAVRPPVRAIPASVARTVTRLMRGVVEFGTGTRAQIPGVAVAGKTGTAELVQTAGCTPSQSSSGASGSSGSSGCGAANDPANTDAWFASFAPASRPRIVIGVLLVHDGAGGDTAAPLARQMLVAGLKAP